MTVSPPTSSRDSYWRDLTCALVLARTVDRVDASDLTRPGICTRGQAAAIASGSSPFEGA